jgi:hypothetical protein
MIEFRYTCVHSGKHHPCETIDFSVPCEKYAPVAQHA